VRIRLQFSPFCSQWLWPLTSNLLAFFLVSSVMCLFLRLPVWLQVNWRHWTDGRGATLDAQILFVLAKLLYASSSWIGFSNATDWQKLQAFLNRSKRSGFCDSEIDDFATLCSTADKQLFNRILNQPEHVYTLSSYCLPIQSSLHLQTTQQATLSRCFLIDWL